MDLCTTCFEFLLGKKRTFICERILLFFCGIKSKVGGGDMERGSVPNEKRI